MERIVILHLNGNSSAQLVAHGVLSSTAIHTGDPELDVFIATAAHMPAGLAVATHALGMFFGSVVADTGEARLQQ